MKTHSDNILAIVPRLVVRDGAAALEFYAKALGATVHDQHTDGDRGGALIHAELRVGPTSFTLTEEKRDWHNDAPPSLGGSPVILTLAVADATSVWNQLVAAGADVVFPLRDQPYGAREGRARDPFGHLWIISQRLHA